MQILYFLSRRTEKFFEKNSKHFALQNCTCRKTRTRVAEEEKGDRNKIERIRSNGIRSNEIDMLKIFT